jgi:CO dehydrogenase maturation factor
MFAVVEPYYKSLETGRRMSMLAKDLGLERVALIANKVRDEKELAAVRQFADQHGLELAAVVPFDENMPGAERAEAAPLDFAPDTPAVVAIGDFARESVGNNGHSGNGRLGNGRA